MGDARRRGTLAQRIELARLREQTDSARHRSAALTGVAAGEFFVPRFEDGRLADPSTVVVPLYRHINAGRAMEVIGTGFFVTQSTVVTARHVAESALAPDSQGFPGLWGIQIIEGGQYYRRPVVNVVMHPTTDIALCVLANMTHRLTGANLSNPLVRLSARDPAIDEHVFTYAYPDTSFEQEGERPRLDLNPHFYDGHITQHHPDGRDRVMLPFPCFETSIHIHGGASGGPVFDAQGAVIGINVSSLNPDTDVSYIAKVRDVFDLQLSCEFTAGQFEDVSLRNLAERGYARMDGGVDG